MFLLILLWAVLAISSYIHQFLLPQNHWTPFDVVVSDLVHTYAHGGIQDFGLGDVGATTCDAGIAAPWLPASPLIPRWANCMAREAAGDFYLLVPQAGKNLPSPLPSPANSVAHSLSSHSLLLPPCCCPQLSQCRELNSHSCPTVARLHMKPGPGRDISASG